MQHKIIKFIFLIFLFNSSISKNINFDNTNLLLKVKNFSNLNGKLVVAIYNNPKNFNSNTVNYRDTTLVVKDSIMLIKFKDIEPGSYAISLYHDENGNGKIDMGGIFNLFPREGFGFSKNNFNGISEPKFNDCKFLINQGDHIEIEIDLVYI